MVNKKDTSSPQNTETVNNNKETEATILTQEKKGGSLQKFFTEHKFVSILLIFVFLVISAGLIYYLNPNTSGLNLMTNRDEAGVGGSRSRSETEQDADETEDESYFSSLLDSESEEQTPVKPPKVEVSPSPIAIAHGLETYNVSQADKTEPQIKTVAFDPLDPDQGETQVIKARINHSQALESVTLKILSDNKETVKEMELETGSASNGTWATSWEVDDTYYYKYAFVLTATSNKEGSVTISVR